MFKIYKAYLFQKVLLKLNKLETKFRNEKNNYYDRQLKEVNDPMKNWLYEQRVVAIGKEELVKSIIEMIEQE